MVPVKWLAHRAIFATLRNWDGILTQCISLLLGVELAWRAAALHPVPVHFCIILTLGQWSNLAL